MTPAGPYRYRYGFMGDRLTTQPDTSKRLAGARVQAERFWRSPLVRVYSPGLLATSVVLTTMFAIKWLA